MDTNFKFTLLWIETQSLYAYYGTFYSKEGECRGQYFNTLKDNCLLWNVIAWSDKRSITWLSKQVKLRRTGKHLQKRNGCRTEKTLCSCSVYNDCIFGCFDTRLCKLVSPYSYGIVVNRISLVVFFQEIVSPHERETLLYQRNEKVYTLWQVH